MKNNLANTSMASMDDPVDEPEIIPVATMVGSAEVASSQDYHSITEPLVVDVNQPQSVVVTVLPSGGMPYGRAPVQMEVCPSCAASQVQTKTRTFPNCSTWLSCIVLFFFFWPIACIPFLCDVFKQTDHHCSRCGAKVAQISPFQDCCEKRLG